MLNFRILPVMALGLICIGGIGGGQGMGQEQQLVEGLTNEQIQNIGSMIGTCEAGSSRGAPCLQNDEIRSAICSRPKSFEGNKACLDNEMCSRLIRWANGQMTGQNPNNPPCKIGS